MSIDRISIITTHHDCSPTAPTVALVDSEGRIFAVRVTPSGPRTPPDFAEGLLSAVEQLKTEYRESTTGATKSRGDYKNLTFGISYGGGSKVSWIKIHSSRCLYLVAVYRCPRN